MSKVTGLMFVFKLVVGSLHEDDEDLLLEVQISVKWFEHHLANP